MGKLRIHAQRRRDLHLSALRIHRQGWGQTARSIVAAEHAPEEDFLPSAVGGAGVLAGRGDGWLGWRGRRGGGDGGVVAGEERLATLRGEDAEGIVQFGRRRVVDVRLGELWGARGAAATAAARHRGLGHRDCTVRPDLAGGDTLFAVAEDVALHVSPSARPLKGKVKDFWSGLQRSD